MSAASFTPSPIVTVGGARLIVDGNRFLSFVVVTEDEDGRGTAHRFMFTATDESGFESQNYRDPSQDYEVGLATIKDH